MSRTDGSDRRRLTSGPERDVSPIWSRDGTRIAFWSAPTATADGYGVDFSVPQMSLVVIEADGSDRRTLADGISFDGVDMEFSWAPDGHAIVFARDAGTRTVVTVAPLDGSPLRDIADGETPRWSPDGSLIAYRSGPPPLAVMAVSEDGRGQVRLTRSAGSSEAFWMPSWSPDGSSLVAFSGRSGAHDIVVVERDGSAERVLADTFRDEYWPVWGPTDRIVFSRVLGSQNRPTFVLIDPDGDNERVLDGLLPEWPGAATWSPDGALLPAVTSMPMSRARSCSTDRPHAVAPRSPSHRPERRECQLAAASRRSQRVVVTAARACPGPQRPCEGVGSRRAPRRPPTSRLPGAATAGPTDTRYAVPMTETAISRPVVGDLPPTSRCRTTPAPCAPCPRSASPAALLLPQGRHARLHHGVVPVPGRLRGVPAGRCP
ncbi:MAG: hypothetical protein R3C32_05370 [Chloroflexota bacterium]